MAGRFRSHQPRCFRKVNNAPDQEGEPGERDREDGNEEGDLHPIRASSEGSEAAGRGAVEAPSGLTAEKMRVGLSG